MNRTTAKDDSKGPGSEPLKWEVFVTPAIPIATRDRPANVPRTYFQAMASTLIYGQNDAVLVDTFMTVEQANALADWVASKHKNLTTIYITHGHGDHWFGVGTILKRFPNARVAATQNTINVMQGNASPQGLAAWGAGFPGQIPEKLVMAEELKGDVIDLEGQELRAVELGHTDTDHTTCLHVPSIGLVVAGVEARASSSSRMTDDDTQRWECVTHRPCVGHLDRPDQNLHRRRSRLMRSHRLEVARLLTRQRLSCPRKMLPVRSLQGSA